MQFIHEKIRTKKVNNSKYNSWYYYENSFISLSSSKVFRDLQVDLGFSKSYIPDYIPRTAKRGGQ